jgi:hypothetical protein
MKAAIFNSTASGSSLIIKDVPRPQSQLAFDERWLGLQYDGDRMQPCLVTAGSESSATH